MSVGKPEVESHDHNGTTARPTKKRKCAMHCKRFWWIYLIVAIIVIVLVVVLVIFVGVPKIAQSKMNEAELEIQGVNILDTQTDSYTMEINSTITTDGSIHADIDGFTGEMYLTDVEPKRVFATIEFPETTSDKHQEVNVSQEVTITDMDAFIEYNIWFTNNESLSLTVEGKTKAQPRGLAKKYDVTFKKELDVPALNLLKGTEVLDGIIELEDDDQGRNFHGRSKIPNASHFTLEIGNVSFINFVEDEEVGFLFIEDLILYPGDNFVNVSAKMDQFAILSLVRSPAYCETGIIPFKLQGNNVTNNGQDLPYFAAGLASANQSVEINIGSIIAASLGTEIGCED